MKHRLVSRTISRRISILGLLAAAFVASISESGAAAQTDPLIGTWKINLTKSTYNPGPAPKGVTITTEMTDQGLRSTFEGLDSAGMPYRVVFANITDGQSHPVTGSPNFDASSGRRVDPYVQVYTISKAGSVVQRGTIVLSPDGRTMTIHGIGVSALTSGAPQADNVSVYEKQ